MALKRLKVDTRFVITFITIQATRHQCPLSVPSYAACYKRHLCELSA